mmetsp:Transcript_30453/g.86082  ORF Transcript_30453/g.86082 Transcript_30453/m.86082 type:complete len:197 (+) Transcript_30453:587-1177(+)
MELVQGLHTLAVLALAEVHLVHGEEATVHQQGLQEGRTLSIVSGYLGSRFLRWSPTSVHPRVANYFPCRVSDQRSTACTREGAGASLACASLASMACMSSACIMTARPPALEPARTMASAPAMPWLRRRSYSNACDIERQMFDLKATMAICINATFACSAQQAKAPIVAAGSVPCAVCVLLKEGGRRGRRAVAMIS